MLATQSFAEAPVVRSYPGEQRPVSAEPAAGPTPAYTHKPVPAHTHSISLAPASALSYRGPPAYEAAVAPAIAPAGAYGHQRPFAYASEAVPPPASGQGEIAIEPSPAPIAQIAPSYGPSAVPSYAPGPEPSPAPVEAPNSGSQMATAPVSVLTPATGTPTGSTVLQAPASAPTAYAPVPAALPYGYGAYGSAASMPGTLSGSFFVT